MHQKHRLTLALSTSVSMLFAAPLEAEGLALNASLTVVSQTVDKPDGADDHQLTNRMDITAERPAGTIGAATGKWFMHLRAGNGAAASNEAFASSNATAADFSAPVLMQAWYQLDIPAAREGRRVEITLGKIDPFGFFDGNCLPDDESEAFLNLAFVHNPLLDAGGDAEPGLHGASPGLRLAHVSPFREGSLSVSAGVFGTGGNGEQFDDIFNNAFSIAQVEYAGKVVAGQEGNYRLYGWNNRNQQHRGWGISFDQVVNSHVGVFARYGHRSTGTGAFDSAWTLGGQVNGVHWGRENDRLGIAYGKLDARAGGSERIGELFYAIQINDHLHITPSLQHINDAAATRGNDRTVYTLRAKIYF